MVIIRTIQKQDAEEFLELCRGLDEETQFMMLEPGERLTTVEEQQEQIKRILSKDNYTILVAEGNGKLGCVRILGQKQEGHLHKTGYDAVLARRTRASLCDLGQNCEGALRLGEKLLSLDAAALTPQVCPPNANAPVSWWVTFKVREGTIGETGIVFTWSLVSFSDSPDKVLGRNC